MKNEDKFFSGIEDTLHSYEDAYAPGAWENFQQERKRRRMGILFFRLGSAAAVLLLLSYITFQFFTKTPVIVQTVSNKKKILPLAPQTIIPAQPKQENTIQPGQTNQTTDQTLTAQHNKKQYDHQQQVNPFTNLAKVETFNNTLKPANKPGYGKSDSIVNSIAAAGNPVKNNTDIYKPAQKAAIIDSALNKPVKGVVQQDRVIADNHVDNKKYPVSGRSVYDSIMNSKVNNRVAAATKKEGKNLVYSVAVTPALGNQKVNFGTGVQVAYKLTDNLYVNSGVGYSSLNGTAAGTDNAGTFSKTQNVSLAVSGFEVPLGLQYRTEGGFYVAAGVMGMGVVNNHLQYDRVVESTATFSAPNAQGFVQQNVRLTTEKKTEESKEQINNYLGFYMLSVGQKKTIGNKKINFGPFMRIPFGGVSSQNVKFLQGGISLGFDF